MFKRYYILKSNIKFTYSNEFVKSFVYDIIDSFNNILCNYMYKYDNDFDFDINCIFNNVLNVFDNLGVIYEKNN